MSLIDKVLSITQTQAINTLLILTPYFECVCKTTLQDFFCICIQQNDRLCGIFHMWK